jgi:hypothetical protein
MNNKNFKQDKFWSLKDTTNYFSANINKLLFKPDVVRLFYFKNSYLLKVRLRRLNNQEVFVSPTSFMSQFFPHGFYQCVYQNKKYTFTDDDIIEVIDV